MGVADLIKKFEKIGGENEDSAESQNVAKNNGAQSKFVQETESDSGDKMHESLEDAVPQNEESQEKFSTIEKPEEAEGAALSSIEDSKRTVSMPLPTESVNISNSPEKLEDTGAAITVEECDKQQGATNTTEAVSDDDSLKKKENEEEEEEEEENENENQEENAEDKRKENEENGKEKKEESGEKSAEAPSSQSSNSKKNKKKKNKKKKKQNAQANSIADNSTKDEPGEENLSLRHD